MKLRVIAGRYALYVGILYAIGKGEKDGFVLFNCCGYSNLLFVYLYGKQKKQINYKQ